MSRVRLFQHETPTDLPPAGAIYLFPNTENNNLMQIDSAGNVFDLAASSGGTFLARNNTGGTIPKGAPVHIDEFDDVNSVFSIILADADDPAAMDAVGVASEDITPANTGGVVFQGIIANIDTSIYSNEGDTLFVSTTAGELTDSRPDGGSTRIQAIADVGKIDPTSGSIIVHGATRSNSLPNIAEDQMWIGDSNGQPITVDKNSIGQTIYDGVDTQANILAMSATTFLGQLWRAIDTDKDYKAVTVIDGSDQWQAIQLLYDETTDTYDLTPTQDGQTQNLGREVFYIAFNDDITGATALDPEVFASFGAKVGDEDFQNVSKVNASDVEEGDTFGINTTALGIGGKGKITTYGEINGVNTSTWSLNDTLYIDPVTKGELTNVQPGINGFNVAKVLKVDATTGKIFVNTISSNRTDIATVPVTNARIFLTGQEITPIATDYWEALLEDEGSVPEVILVVNVPDNDIVAGTQDHLTSPVQTEEATLQAGLRTGQIDFQISDSGGQEKIYFEIYRADADGVPLESGVTGAPVGDLGVTVLFIMQTARMDVDPNDPFQYEVRGQLIEDVTILVDQRIRIHYLCEKIGTLGGTKSFDLFFGSDHDSFIDAIAPIQIDDVEGLQEALDVSLNEGGLWTDGSTFLKNYVYRENEWAGWPTVDTLDHLEPQPIGDSENSIDPDNFPTTTNVSIVNQVHKFTFTEDVFTQALQVFAPGWDASTVTKVTVFNVTTSEVNIIDNPLLDPDGFVTLAIGSLIYFSGTQLDISLQIYNTTPASSVDGGWTSSTALPPPASQAFTIDDLVTPTVIELSHTDLDSNDRSTELDGVTSGSVVRIVETGSVNRNIEFIVDTVNTTPINSTEYTVLAGSITNGPQNIRNNRTCTVDIDIPITQPTEYGVKTGFYPAGNPSWATITTELYYDGVLQAGTVDGFGINVIAQQAIVSPDWFFLAVSGGGGGGGGGTGDPSPLVSKGDLYTFDTADQRLPVGDNGQLLEANSIAGTGLKWVTPAGGSGDVVGPVSSVVGAIAVWDNTIGTLLADSPGNINKTNGQFLLTYTGPDSPAFSINASSSTLAGQPLVDWLILSTGTQIALDIRNNGDAQPWMRVGYNTGGTGKPGIVFGVGVSAGDTNLFREGLDVLKTSDKFEAGSAEFFGQVAIDFDGADVQVFRIDASGSSISVQPAFEVVLPATGSQKGFQLINGSDVNAWASFEKTFGGGSDPGFALGPGGSSSRDTNLYRASANILKTDDKFEAATLQIFGTALFSGLVNVEGDLDLVNTSAGKLFIGDGATITGTEDLINLRIQNTDVFGITFWESATFHMSFRYDGSGTGDDNFMGWYDSTDVLIASVREGGTLRYASPFTGTNAEDIPSRQWVLDNAGGGGAAFPITYISGAEMEIPNNSGWTVSAPAATLIDSTNTQYSVAKFDDTTEQGRGFKLKVPSGASNIQVVIKNRRASGSTAANIGFTWNTQLIPNNATVPSWTTANSSFSAATNTNYQEDTIISGTLGSVGMAAGNEYLVEYVRNTIADTLSGDWYLLTLQVTYT